jgi:uncharacterized protein YecE (DUF72 family)
MTIRVGTASWTDKTLIDSGKFYPSDCKSAEARLRFYATQFPMVEVDASYYAIPAPETAQLWAERTPADFTFNVKAFRLFTGHQTDPKVLEKDIREALPATEKKMLYYRDVPLDIQDELWRRFKLALAPLDLNGKLQAVHFQFAPWVINDRDGRAHVQECVERMQDHRLTVEFRNKVWFDDAHRMRTLEFERELGVVHTIVDAPQGFHTSVPPVWEITNTELALVRLHGRNHATWNIKGARSASDRFNYDYTEAELADLVPRLKDLVQRVPLVQVIFNNNYEDQGQRNGAALLRLLAQAGA